MPATVVHVVHTNGVTRVLDRFAKKATSLLYLRSLSGEELARLGIRRFSTTKRFFSLLGRGT